jgi:hypothetical protein
MSTGATERNALRDTICNCNYVGLFIFTADIQI